MTFLHGCDVSVFQDPRLVDWNQRDFGIVRATYGTSPDKRTLQHVERIRAAGKVAGLYHFFRPDQSIDAQLETFGRVAEAVALGPGDMLPCVDVEDYPDQWSGGVAKHWAPVAHAWEAPLTELVAGLTERFGGVVLYVTQRDWGRLGKPDWALKLPLWVANYPRKGATSPLKSPATPGNVPWRLWQWLVGPLGQTLQDHTHKLAVDQNIATSPLPLIGETAVEVVPEPYETERAIPYCLLTDEDWDEMRAARDQHVLEET